MKKVLGAAILAFSFPGVHAGDVLISDVAVQDRTVQLHVAGPPAMVYSLDRSDDLRSWRTIDFSNNESGRVTFTNLNQASIGFYRVRLDLPQTQVQTNEYEGWTNCFVLSNTVAQVQVVPAIGRIMQFRFNDSPEGPFWENPLMFGRAPAANSWDTAGSFGGDKAWPAPQSLWNWPPPRGFDSMSFTGQASSGGVLLTGPIDPTFGIRVVREITLHPTESIMKVVTHFEKIVGSPAQVSVWTITQVKDADAVFIAIPPQSVYPNGYVGLGTLPSGLAVTNGLISLQRNPSAGTKIGSDAGTIVWVGTNDVLLIESPRLPAGSAYPDQGSSAEVYTNPDPVPYLELEFLGPTATIANGEPLEKTSIYTLLRRTGSNPVAEAKQIESLH